MFESRGATRWKLASYEVAGDAPARLVRPDRTMDSAVPSGRIAFGAVNQTLRVWLISGCPVGTNADGARVVPTRSGYARAERVKSFRMD